MKSATDFEGNVWRQCDFCEDKTINIIRPPSEWAVGLDASHMKSKGKRNAITPLVFARSSTESHIDLITDGHPSNFHGYNDTASAFDSLHLTRSKDNSERELSSNRPMTAYQLHLPDSPSSFRFH